MPQLAAAVLLAATTACGSTAAQTQAADADRQICETDGRPVVAPYSRSLTLAAALPTTAGAAAQWEYTRNGPNGPRPLVSRWSALPASHKLVFCYFDGDFADFRPSSPRGFVGVYERALVLVPNGETPWLDHIGPKATNPLT